MYAYLTLSSLRSFLRFPSISADSSKKQAVKDCAVWLYKHLKEIGLHTVKMYATPLHPIVYAEHITDSSYPTILFYGHYDVQPAAPLKEWKHPPFEPVVKGDYIHARGASDDKGQLFIHVKAIQQLLQESGSLPVNVKCLFEGEEEIGSPHLEQFIKANQELLQCNVAVVSDTKMLSADQPALTYSLRGALNAEVTLKREGKELHSGTFGGMVQNPVNVIAKLVANLHDAKGRVRLPGFYDSVTPVSKEEAAFMCRNGPPDAVMLQDAGTSASRGEAGFSNYERTTIRPSLTISTITGGYSGEGVKNVIPTEATIKINMRLVGGQDPQLIASQLSSLVRNGLPVGCSCQLKCSSMVRPVQVSRDNFYMRAAAQAYGQVFHQPPVFLRSGGTIPVVSLFKDILNIPTVLMGFALATDDMHAPNEKFYLPNFVRGIETSIRFMLNVSCLSFKKKPYATLSHH